MLLEVTDPEPPRADTVYTVPIDARVKNVTPPRELPLFIVRGGLLDSIKVVDYSGNEPPGLPSPRELEAPNLYAAGNDR